MVGDCQLTVLLMVGDCQLTVLLMVGDLSTDGVTDGG